MKILPTLITEGEMTEEYILSVLPQFFSVKPEIISEYIHNMRQALSCNNIDMFLTLLKKSFSQFFYNDFSELEQHYRNHLKLVAGLMNNISGFHSDFTQEGSVYFRVPDNVIVFNLRGTAEDGLNKGEKYIHRNEKLSDVNIVSASFSAFDRTIDRWVKL